jgi:hypothetical protein
MYSYAFYVLQAGDIHLTLEVHTLPSTDVAKAWAKKILDQQPDAEHVIVKREGTVVLTERQAGTESRPPFLATRPSRNQTSDIGSRGPARTGARCLGPGTFRT